jgi:dTDP-L-rhamnose 4-epimerase
VYGEGRQRCGGCGHGFTGRARRVVDMDAARWAVTCPRCGGPGVAEPTPEDSSLAPTSIYGLTKLQQEQLAHNVGETHGLPITILRFFNVFGPGQSMLNPYVGVLGVFFRRARAAAPVEVYEDGLMLRDFVFVDDVVEVLSRCTGNPVTFGRTWNVATGRPISLLEIAESVFEAMNVEPNLWVSGRYRVGDIRHAVAEVSRLEAELGCRPATPFTEGLRRFVAWAAATGADAPDRRAEEQLCARRLLRGATS